MKTRIWFSVAQITISFGLVNVIIIALCETFEFKASVFNYLYVNLFLFLIMIAALCLRDVRANKKEIQELKTHNIKELRKIVEESPIFVKLVEKYTIIDETVTTPLIKLQKMYGILIKSMSHDEDK